MLRASFDQIINEGLIGARENHITNNELYRLAARETLTPASEDNSRTLFIGIDVQNDFMDKGELGVAGAVADTNRLLGWFYRNMEKITAVKASIDTHNPFQIFFPSWWIDKDGNHPNDYQVITLADYDNGTWRPVIEPVLSRKYLEGLEATGKYVLVIWPYHCIQGTFGAALENQFANMIYFHSIARQRVVSRIQKGQDALTEMYGIFEPEFDPRGKGSINLAALNDMERYDRIYFAGQAKSHCVLATIGQALKHYETRPEVTSKFFILEDCMSSIGGYEAATEKTFEGWKAQYNVNIVDSTCDI